MANQILKLHPILLRTTSLRMTTTPDVDSLIHGNGLKDIIDILDDKIMSIIEILERNGLTTSQEFKEIMQERIIKNAKYF